MARKATGTLTRAAGRYVMLLFGAILVVSPAIASSDSVSSTGMPVFVNGTGGYHCYRIPAIVQTPHGSLLAFAEARRNSCLDFGEVRIVMRTSRDGKHWGRMQTVATNGDLQAGNPAPVVDTMDPRYPRGRVLLVYATGDAPESAIREGRGGRRLWYRATTDDGVTWSEPVEITASVKPPAWRSYGVGPGHGVQQQHGRHKGRILIAAYHSKGPPQLGYRDSQAHIMWSDDHGQTWSLGATVPHRGSNESTAAENGDGSIVMNSRDQTGDSHARIVSISKDAGAHWDKTFLARDLPDPVCEGSIVSDPRTFRKPLLFFSNEASISKRESLTVSESVDGGRTWPRHALIYDGPASYSDLVVMRGRMLGILFERGDDGLVFLTRPIAHLF